jgi:prolyl-tRNA synthetase
MRQSKLFGKTSKSISSDIKITSHKLLIKAGFIAESVAGRYYFLPLGWRVHDKIKAVIKSEMDRTGAQEMITPVLHPLELWEETNRTNTTGFELMNVKDRRGGEFALGGTAEEMFVDLVRKMEISYRDLPFNIYQFSTKFRDELRARGGLLRVREFVMKDAYSFDVDEKEFLKEYKNMEETYTRIYNRLGLDTFVVLADNGYIGGEYCHEFQVESDIGEGRFFVSEDGEYIAHEDVAKFEIDNINIDEKEEDLEIAEQPKWVKTMEDNVKNYKLPKSRFLKNVVYKNITNDEIIIVTLRGDIDVNKTKLEKVLDAVGQLTEATEEDLTSIGTKPGYVHSWGHKGVRYIGDLSLETVKNFIGGQKEDETDSINVNYGRDFKCEMLVDVAMAYDGALTEKNGKLIEKKGIEVGNIFQLGYHYSSKMKGTEFTDKDGKKKPYYMGCYGIGLGRTMAAVIEKHNDEKGMIWPESIAPYKVHLISIKKNAEAEKLYNELLEEGVEVLFDDRDNMPGEKFADSDLIGCPIRLVVSAKTLKENSVEYKRRDSDKIEIVKRDELLSKICNL